ncbi:CHAT domain-containing protein [Amycolatopsis sp. cg9]|uniref:CHAT domain-containing protein n=1 Tax=Amycolatopsis sp. cg9 TaxID=3238801 RepID=UPI003524EDCE
MPDHDPRPSRSARRARARGQLADGLAWTSAGLLRRGLSGGPLALRVAPWLCGLAARVTPESHPERAWRCSAVGLLLEKRFDRSGAPEVLDRALDWQRSALRGAPPGHPDRGLCLNNSVTTMLNRPDLVDEALGNAREAVELATAGTTAFHGRLSTLALALLRRHELVGDPDALAEAAAFLRPVVRDAGGRGDFGPVQTFLSVLEECHEISGDPGLLEEGVALARDALAHEELRGAERAMVLDSFAGLLRWIYEYGEDLGVLDEAVGLQRDALALLPPGNVNDSRMRAHLGILLRIRHDHTRSPADIEEAVVLAEEAVAASGDEPVERARRISQLVNALQSHFVSTADERLLARATRWGRQAVDLLPPDHPEHADHLSNLVNVLAGGSSHEQVTEAIELAREALRRTPGDHANARSRKVTLASLLWLACCSDGRESALREAQDLAGQVLSTEDGDDHHSVRRAARRVLADAQLLSYRLNGDPAMLLGAVAAFRAAAAEVSADHRRHATVQADVADALWDEYQHSGESAVLDEAVAVCRAALDRLAPGDSARSQLLSVLGNSLWARAEQPGSHGVLDEAIACLEEVAELFPPGAGNRWIALNNLTSILRYRQDVDHGRDTASPPDVERLARAAVRECPREHPDRGMVLSTLSLVLAVTAEEEAVVAAREAVRTTPAGFPVRGRYLVNLAELLKARWERRKTDRVAWQEAVDAFREAAESPVSAAHIRVDAAASWGGLAAGAGEWKAALEGYEYAIELLPRLVPRSLPRTDQQRHLMRLSTLSADAAACAVRLHDPLRALVVAEHSRTVLAAQLLESWPEREAVARLAPELARRLDLQATELGRHEHDDADRAGRRRAAEGWEKLVERVREFPELAGFLRPPGARELLGAASDGPVVVVNSSRFGSHALVVERAGVRALPLPDLEPAAVRHQAGRFLGAVDDVEDIENPSGPREGNQVMTEILRWLWRTVAEPVLGSLDRTAPVEAGGTWSRLWWSPTGLLSVLPLHAAGTEGPGNSVLDRVVSSYALSLRVLLQRQPAPVPADPRLLVVDPDQGDDLGGAALEGGFLEKCFPGRTTRLTGAEADRERVLQELPAHSWVHFACHAISELEDPSASHLVVHDAAEHPLRVRDVDRVHLPDAEFAYLAACDTVGVSALPNEAIHLAAAFHLAGFRSVVGTLWSVSDRVSVRCAEQFYAEVPGIRSHALALHGVVRDLRRRWSRHPSVWAALVHIGH